MPDREKRKDTDNVVVAVKIGTRQSRVVIARSGGESLTSRVIDACRSAFGPGRLEIGKKKQSFDWIKDADDTEPDV